MISDGEYHMAKGHILIVDDEENILNSLEGILSDEGFQVSKAKDGCQALKIIRSDPPPDLVMLDIWIPGMDGLEVLQAAKTLRSDLEIIMISGHGSIDTAVKATKLGAFDFIEKPLSLENVILTVNHALGQQRLLRNETQVERNFSYRGEVVGKSAHIEEVRQFIIQAGTQEEKKEGPPAEPKSKGHKKAIRSPQRTLSRSVVLCGQGLHSGIKSGMILLPLPPFSGIHFSNISTGYTIPAHLDYVDSTQYATILKRGSSCVRTVEHLLAVLHLYGISNLLIKVNDEVPIMDGSAREFCRLIEDGGIEEQEAEEEVLVIDRHYRVGNPKERVMSIEPFSGLAIRYSMDLPLPIGRQEIFYAFEGIEGFTTQIAPARTFVFLKEVEYLEARGLTKGGRLNNVILLDQEKVINTSLRFPDEFVRHKVLDIVGDLYLLGRPIHGLVTARMTGHTENLQLVKEIRHLANED